MEFAKATAHSTSVWAFHPASRTFHVDDTLVYLPYTNFIVRVSLSILSHHLLGGKILELSLYMKI